MEALGLTIGCGYWWNDDNLSMPGEELAIRSAMFLVLLLVLVMMTRMVRMRCCSLEIRDFQASNQCVSCVIVSSVVMWGY